MFKEQLGAYFVCRHMESKEHKDKRPVGQKSSLLSFFSKLPAAATTTATTTTTKASESVMGEEGGGEDGGITTTTSALRQALLAAAKLFPTKIPTPTGLAAPHSPSTTRASTSSSAGARGGVADLDLRASALRGEGGEPFTAGCSLALLGVFPLIAKAVLGALQRRQVYARWPRPKRFDRNMVVIGAGAAGLVTSYIAAAVKAKVTLVESHKMGGDCLNYGCVPSKALIRSAKLVKQIRTSATYGMPMVVELGIALDVLIGVLILGVFMFQIREQFDSLDIRQGHKKRKRL